MSVTCDQPPCLTNCHKTYKLYFTYCCHRSVTSVWKNGGEEAVWLRKTTMAYPVCLVHSEKCYLVQVGNDELELVFVVEIGGKEGDSRGHPYDMKPQRLEIVVRDFCLPRSHLWMGGWGVMGRWGVMERRGVMGGQGVMRGWDVMRGLGVAGGWSAMGGCDVMGRWGVMGTLRL